MNKRNLMFAATLSICFALSTLSTQATTHIGSGETLTLPNASVSTEGMSAEYTVEIDKRVYPAGGAILNELGTLNVSDVTFKDNKAAGGYAGAIYNIGNSNIKSALFNNNNAFIGGAIMNAFGQMNITDTDFTNNTALSTGAIYNQLSNDGNHPVLTITNGTFKNNSAGDVGAVGNFGIMSITGTKFIKNHATGTSSGDEGGGAMFLGSVSQSVLNNVTFEGNTSAKSGGAIATRTSNRGNNIAAKLDIYNSTFKNNHADTDGGAIDNYFHGANVVNTKFTGNTANRNGGAIMNNIGGTKDSNAGSINISNSTFKGNSAKENGGAIYNALDAVTNIGNNVSFIENSANNGGAIYNAGTITIGNNAIFKDNKVFEYSPDGHGNDIFNNKGTISIGNNAYFGRKEIPDYHDCGIYSPNGGSITIGDNATFENIREAIVTSGGTTLNIGDNAHFNGNLYGIDLWSAGDTTIGKNAVFENGIGRAITIENYFTNTLTIDDGVIFRNNNNIYENPNTSFGIIYNGTGSTIHFLGSAEFSNNSTPNNVAGVIQNWNKLIFDGNTKFINNYAGGDAGALRNRGENSDTVFNSTVEFIGNKADGNGGAILNQGKVTFNAASNFNGNSAGKSGGAIYTETELAIKDANFTNNTANEKGGAIFANSDLTVSAIAKDVVFAGNKAVDGADIYMNKAASTLTINLDNEKVLTIKDGISGHQDKYNIKIDGFGNVDLQSYIKNANVTVKDATLWLNTGSQVNGLNNSITMNNNSELITVNNKIETFDKGLFTLNGDVDLAVDVDLATGKTDFFKNAISNASTGKFILEGVKPIANTTNNIVKINLYEALGLDKNSVEINPSEFVAMKALTPIRYLSGSVSESGILTYAPTGNSYKDFNPSVMASAVAAQLGGYLTQLNSYDEAFRNMDMYMLMTKKQRQAMKLRNKYAAADSQLTFSPLPESPYTGTAGWFRPYATFENVHLKGGPRVSNVAYGSFFGAESEMYDLGHGWDGMWGAYIGYNGSHQSFNGISMYQNGGTLGAVGMAYKGNFFTGLTINAGANGVEASTMYGTDNFSMLMAGIASKTGYNIELADGKFIIQPNFMMSYSFVNTFDYTNAAGVKINSSPLNAIQIEPGLKFIGNLKNGWQPYLGVSMVWNIMDKTQFNANDVSLPDLSVKPFVRYGIGVRKTWGERITGFFQCYFTNGGRNGVGLQAGFRMTIGKAPNSIHKQSSTPQLKKTEIKLGCNR